MNLLNRFGGRIWDPWREIGQLQNEIGRVLEGARRHTGFGQRELPAVNFYANENDVLLMLELAGIDPAKVDITLTGDTVTIQGEHATETVGPDENFHRRERPTGSFKRTVQLPFAVEPAKTEATYEKGVLSVRLGRPESQKPKKVLVKSV
jgi:HSP20 family protein